MKLIKLAALMWLYVLVSACSDQSQEPVVAEAGTVAEETVVAALELSSVVVNFYRHSDKIITGGELSAGAVDALTSAGVGTVVDLRRAVEGTADEATAMAAAGIAYHNIEMGRQLPDAATMARFAEVVQGAGDGALLIHCRSGNRVGTAWALYRLSQGVSIDDALAEGSAMGMSQGRAQMVIDSLAP